MHSCGNIQMAQGFIDAFGVTAIGDLLPALGSQQLPTKEMMTAATQTEGVSWFWEESKEEIIESSQPATSSTQPSEMAWAWGNLVNETGMPLLEPISPYDVKTPTPSVNESTDEGSKRRVLDPQLPEVVVSSEGEDGDFCDPYVAQLQVLNEWRATKESISLPTPKTPDEANILTVYAYYEGDDIWEGTVYILDAFIFTFFGMEMLIKAVALGIVGHEESLFRYNWNKFNIFIICGEVLDHFLASLGILSGLPVFSPMRLIDQVPSMRVLVTDICNTLPMLVNVFVLYIFIIHIFGVMGVQMWAGQLRNRCFMEEEISTRHHHPVLRPTTERETEEPPVGLSIKRLLDKFKSFILCTFSRSDTEQTTWELWRGRGASAAGERCGGGSGGRGQVREGSTPVEEKANHAPLSHTVGAGPGEGRYKKTRRRAQRREGLREDGCERPGV
ncbi:hypothetical protein PAMA_020914 [Pampus argenteus]